MRHTVRETVTRRLKLVEGQVRGLQRMVAEDAYCVDIITQASAARRALSAVEDVVLENHLSTHVVEQMKSGKHKRAIGEMMDIYKISKKK